MSAKYHTDPAPELGRRPKASRPMEALPKAAILQIHKPDTVDLATLAGLTKVTGEPSYRLRRLLLKELADNALDACDAAGRLGKVTIRKRGRDTYIITDEGQGLDGSPDDLAALFAIHRVMISTKYRRLPQRGCLGNGFRIVTGCVVASRGTIEVIARGKHVVLRPRQAGPTEIVSISDAPDTVGTTLIVTLDPTIPYDADELIWADAAIDLGRWAAEPPYARAPSPHWIDLDAFLEMLMLIEPDTVTVRQVVGLFDGCSGGKGGKIAAPFGKNRLARSMSDSEAAALLTSMQTNTRAVKTGAFSPIGADAFDPDDYSYASAKGTFAYGAHDPHAEIVHIVEAWVCATSRRGKSVEIEAVFANRTPIVGGEVTAERDTYDPKHLEFFGCGIDGIDDFPLGDFRVSLHIISPYIPLLSTGKRPHLEPFMPAIAEALRRAFKRSRDLLPLDMPEPKVKPPPKPPRQPKVERPPKPAPAIFEPRTPLGKQITVQAEATGILQRNLLVLSKGNDPYDLDNANGHKIAAWLAVQAARLVRDDSDVHLRGLFYRIVASAAAYRPDTGELFANTEANWRWLQQKAAKAARWFGYMPFRRIRDERSDPPEMYAANGSAIYLGNQGLLRSLGVGRGEAGGAAHGSPVHVLATDQFMPRLYSEGASLPPQPFRLAFIGEKSSLAEVLRPIAREFYAELLLSSGDQSETHIAEMAARAAADPRPFVVLFFADFDPSGWNMPVAVARKLQAHRDLHYPKLEVQVHRVALTLAQCIAYNLPSTPLKKSEKRAEKWLAKWGREQTEIDALAALRPEVLEQIARDAVAPFYDTSLSSRFYTAIALPQDSYAWFTGLPAYVSAQDTITRAHGLLASVATTFNATIETFNAAVETFNATVSEQTMLVRDAVQSAADAPKLNPVTIEPQTAETPDPLFTTADSFVEATRKLIASKRDFDDDSGDDAEGGQP
jgi:hypothetical protein